MHAIPQKISLVAETEEVLLHGMRQRRWQHELPGERHLSRELRVSRWTLRAALAQLERKGCLQISQGLPCRISPLALENGSSRAQPRALKVGLVVPAPFSKLSAFVSLWVDELRVILNAEGISFNVHECARAYGPNPQQVLVNLLEKHPHDEWILLLSTRAMQEWFQKRSEFTFIAGTRFNGIECPAVDIDSHALGVHAAHTLLGQGHRAIAFLAPLLPAAGVLAAEAGLREVISKSRFADANLTVLRCNEEPLDICRAVDRLMAEPVTPTALVGGRAAITLTAFSHLTRIGLRVPQDISLLSIEWGPYLDIVVPRIAHYRISPDRFARQVARVIVRHSIGTGHATYLTPEFVPGASLCRQLAPRAAAPEDPQKPAVLFSRPAKLF